MPAAPLPSAGGAETFYVPNTAHRERKGWAGFSVETSLMNQNPISDIVLSVLLWWHTNQRPSMHNGFIIDYTVYTVVTTKKYFQNSLEA